MNILITGKKLLSRAKDAKILPALFFKIQLNMRTVFTLLLFFNYSTHYGQGVGWDKKFDVSFENTSLEEVFNELSKLSGFNFSFNANLLPLSEKVNLKMTNISLNQILKILLDKYQVDFKEISNQVIIYSVNKPSYEIVKTKTNDHLDLKPGNSIQSVSKKEEVITKKIIYDTIRMKVTDTIKIYDTVRRIINDTIKHIDVTKIHKYDTVKIYDTIKIYKKPEVKQLPKRNIPVVITYPFFTYEISASGQLSSYALKNNDSVTNIFNQIKAVKSPGIGFNIDASLNFNLKHLVFQTGLEYNYRSENWDYSSKIKGGYYTKDTVSKYYTEIHGTDTVWVYITRDKWIETLTISKYKTRLNYHYLSIPFIAGYRYNFKKASIEVKGGIISSFFLMTNGEGVFNKDSLVVESVNNKKISFTKVNFSTYFAINFNFAIFTNTFFLIEPYFYWNLNSIYKKSFFYSQKFEYLGIKVGIRKKIK